VCKKWSRVAKVIPMVYACGVPIEVGFIEVSYKK
jgi:hypothetical protein